VNGAVQTGRRVPTCRKLDFACTRNAVVISPERDKLEFTVYDFAVLTTVIPTSSPSVEHGKHNGLRFSNTDGSYGA